MRAIILTDRQARWAPPLALSTSKRFFLPLGQKDLAKIVDVAKEGLYAHGVFPDAMVYFSLSPGISRIPNSEDSLAYPELRLRDIVPGCPHFRVSGYDLQSSRQSVLFRLFSKGCSIRAIFALGILSQSPGG